MGCEAIAVHEAYKQGDLEALRTLLGNPPDFPNCRGPRGVGDIILEYAIYHSPLSFVRTLLELGADPNYEDPAGFPHSSRRYPPTVRTSTSSWSCYSLAV